MEKTLCARKKRSRRAERWDFNYFVLLERVKMYSNCTEMLIVKVENNCI